MRRILATVVLCLISCAQKKVDPPPPFTCLDYATALLGMCFDAVGTEDVESQLQCDSGLLEAGYNACYMALETGVDVCVPYRDRMSSGNSAGHTLHACSGYVHPPAPANWRGEKHDEIEAERDP